MIRKLKHTKLSIISLLLFATFTSCVKEPLGFDDNEEHGKGVKISFQLTVPEPKKIETRGVVDDALNSVYLLVFGSDDKFIEWTQANENSDAPYNFVATLTEQSDACNIYVIANTPTLMGSAVVRTWEPGITTLDNVKADLIKASLVSEGEDFIHIGNVPVIPPMICAAPISGPIQKSMKIDGIVMVRTMAKVTVAVNESLDNFILNGATLCNAPIRGYVFDEMTLSEGDAAVKDCYGLSGSYSLENMTRKGDIDEPLYCYESISGNGTFVIIHASYNGIDGYYKITLKKTVGVQLALQRNCWYKVNVNKVTTPGYRTAAEARSNTALNDLPGNDVTIDVIDGYSHDIVSNGEYYLGVENSEFIIYSTGQLTDELVTRVQCNAPSSVAKGQMTFTAKNGEGETITSGGVSVSDPFAATNDGSVQSADLKITIPETITSMTIQLRIGNLTRTLKVTRKLSFLGNQQMIKEFVGEKYVYAEFKTAQDWIEFTEHPSETAKNGGGYKLFISKNETHGTRSARFFISKNNADGRIKVVVHQQMYKSPEVITDISHAYDYIGAFWRKTETGERLIRLTKELTPGSNWSATVYWKDTRWRYDNTDIVLDNYDLPSYPAILSAGADAEARQVTNSISSTIEGTVSAQGSIYFRIGLKTKYYPSSEYPARYAVVLVTANDGAYRRKLYLRQGEDADYVMRPSDPIPAEVLPQEYNNHNVSQTVMDKTRLRPYAAKFSPYNLTAPGANWSSGSKVSDHPQLTYQGATFVEFPTMAGAFFQWGLPTKNTTQIGRAYNPINPFGAPYYAAGLTTAIAPLKAVQAGVYHGNGDWWAYYGADDWNSEYALIWSKTQNDWVAPADALPTPKPNPSPSIGFWTGTKDMIPYKYDTPVWPETGEARNIREDGGVRFVNTPLYLTNELCPSGYHRPNDGMTDFPNVRGYQVDTEFKTYELEKWPYINSDRPYAPDTYIYGAEGTTADYKTEPGSEFRQSLWASPVAGYYGPGKTDLNRLDNFVFGDYADGYYDRREVEEVKNYWGRDLYIVGLTPKTSTNSAAAFRGGLFYNPETNASLFFPAAGARSLDNGAITPYASYGGYYWSSSSNGNINGNHLLVGTKDIDVVNVDQAHIAIAPKFWGYSIRCVKNE